MQTNRTCSTFAALFAGTGHFGDVRCTHQQKSPARREPGQVVGGTLQSNIATAESQQALKHIPPSMSAFGPKRTSAFAPHLGGKADMTVCASPLSQSLSGVKRTCLFALHMSAFDPKRTSASALHMSAPDPIVALLRDFGAVRQMPESSKRARCPTVGLPARLARARLQPP